MWPYKAEQDGISPTVLSLSGAAQGIAFPGKIPSASLLPAPAPAPAPTPSGEIPASPGWGQRTQALQARPQDFGTRGDM